MLEIKFKQLLKKRKTILLNPPKIIQMRKIFALYTLLLLIATTGCSNSSMQKKSNDMDSIQPDKEAPLLTPLPSLDTLTPSIDSILALREKEIQPLPPIKKEIKRNGDLLPQAASSSPIFAEVHRKPDFSPGCADRRKSLYTGQHRYGCGSQDLH